MITQFYGLSVFFTVFWKSGIALGAVPEPMTPAQFGTLIASAATKWAKVISFANIKVD